MKNTDGPIITDGLKRLIFYIAEFQTFHPKPPQLLEKHLARFTEGVNRFETTLKLLSERQKQLRAIFTIIRNADLTVLKDEDILSSERRAMLQLARHTGQQKIIRVHDQEIIRPARLDSDYKGVGGQQFFVFSTMPRPGVYGFPVNGRGVSTDPVYTPFTKEGAK